MFDKTRKPAIHHATSTRGRGHRMSARQRKAAQAAFLASSAFTANITAACSQANIDRSTFYEWTEHDEQFSMRYHQAGEAATDVLLAAAWHRAVRGVERYKLHNGAPVMLKVGEDAEGKAIMSPLIEREYSDTVLLRLLAWRIPAFRTNSQGDADNTILPKEYVISDGPDGFNPELEGTEE